MITKVIDNLDELYHVDSSELTQIKSSLEDVQEKLDELADAYGDAEGDLLGDVGDMDDDSEYAPPDEH